MKKSQKQSVGMLPEQKWSFHKIPVPELKTAWVWEMDCELGSRAKPWLSLSKLEKKRARAASGVKYESAVDEYELKHANAGFIAYFQKFFRIDGSETAQQYQLHFLRIDWGKSKPTILRELTEWIETHLAAVPHGQAIDKGGRKNQFAAWFTDLAIYRASEAGITRSAAIKAMDVLFAACPTKTSASHWEDAQKRTRARLEDRQKFLRRQDSFTRTMRYIRENHGHSEALDEILYLGRPKRQ